MEEKLNEILKNQQILYNKLNRIEELCKECIKEAKDPHFASNYVANIAGVLTDQIITKKKI